MPTEAPTAVTTLPILDPPVLLSANRTDRGVLLQWSPPEASSSPLTGYVLEVRRDQAQWFILSSNISANQSELLVQGLLRVEISLFVLCQHLFQRSVSVASGFLAVTTLLQVDQIAIVPNIVIQYVSN